MDDLPPGVECPSTRCSAPKNEALGLMYYVTGQGWDDLSPGRRRRSGREAAGRRVGARASGDSGAWLGHHGRVVSRPVHREGARRSVSTRRRRAGHHGGDGVDPRRGPHRLPVGPGALGGDGRRGGSRSRSVSDGWRSGAQAGGADGRPGVRRADPRGVGRGGLFGTGRCLAGEGRRRQPSHGRSASRRQGYGGPVERAGAPRSGRTPPCWTWRCSATTRPPAWATP